MTINTKKLITQKSLVSLMLASLLAACGGGSSDTNKDDGGASPVVDGVDTGGISSGPDVDVGGPRPRDSDNDSIADVVDNCPSVANTDQQDSDQDGLGDVCDIDGQDADNDGVLNENDARPADPTIAGIYTNEQNFGADDTNDYRQIAYYHANGSLTKVKTERINGFENDFLFNAVRTYSYDADGKKTQEIYNRRNDGMVEQVSTYRYDEQGNPTQKVDTFNNAASTTTTTYENEYMAGNKLSRVTSSEGTGKVTSYTYHANGNLSKVEVRTGGSSTPNLIETYDSAGRITGSKRDTRNDGFDGADDITTVYFYNNGVQVSKTVTQANRTVAYRFTYDNNTRLTNASQGVLFSDRLDATWAYEYNTDGRLSKQTKVTKTYYPAAVVENTVTDTYSYNGTFDNVETFAFLSIPY